MQFSILLAIGVARGTMPPLPAVAYASMPLPGDVVEDAVADDRGIAEDGYACALVVSVPPPPSM
jgi:hypothetical protein